MAHLATTIAKAMSCVAMTLQMHGMHGQAKTMPYHGQCPVLQMQVTAMPRHVTGCQAIPG